MTIFQSTQMYASQLDVSYDESRELYIGDLVSRGGVHRVEGMNRADVTYAMDALLQEEYHEMLRGVKDQNARVIGGGRSRGGGSSATPEKVEGMAIKTYAPGELKQKNSGSFKWVELVMGAASLGQGNFLEAALSVISIKLGDWFDGVESLWDKDTSKKPLFAVSFGGILITAVSKKMLKKKLRRQMNKRIQRIMMNVKYHNMARESLTPTKGDSKQAISRLRKKKQRAVEHWRARVSPQGRQKNWRGRTINLRNRLQDKKEKANLMWVERNL